MNQFLIILSFFLLFSCKEKPKEQRLSKKQLHQFAQQSKNENDLKDATVEYFNPKTGTRSTYQLKVLVIDNKLRCIYWRAGGFLDEHHFTAPDISSGHASITTDRGLEYTVKLNH